MAEGRNDDSVAPRRSLGGPIMPPPPPASAEEAGRAEQARAEAQRAAEQRQVADQAAQREQADGDRAKAVAAQRAQAEQDRPKAERANRPGRPSLSSLVKPKQQKQQSVPGTTSAAPAKTGAPRRTRRAQLRLVQVDAWSVMKTAFLLSIALGIVLVVAVAIIWSVLGAAGVWDSINSIVQQAIGSDNGDPFDIQEYAGTSRVLGFTMIVAVLDVILITAIATLGAFLYNLSAALLGGIEVTLAEDN